MKVKIVGEYIKLGQLIKKLNIIDTGGQSKYFLSTHEVKINEQIATKRNSKIYVGSTV